MDKRLEKVEEAVADIREKVYEIAIGTAENKIQLKEHMSRTEAVEESNKLLKELIEEHRKEFNKKLTPLQKFIDRFKFLIYVLGILGSCVLALAKAGFISL